MIELMKELKGDQMYDKVFCAKLVLRKSWLALENYFLCIFYSAEQIQRFHSGKKDSSYWQTWTALHLCIGELFVRQPIYRSKLRKDINGFYLV